MTGGKIILHCYHPEGRFPFVGEVHENVPTSIATQDQLEGSDIIVEMRILGGMLEPLAALLGRWALWSVVEDSDGGETDFGTLWRGRRPPVQPILP